MWSVSTRRPIPTTRSLDARLCARAASLGTRFADGTVFFVDNRDDYLHWVWDIPISPGQTSVGFVLSADAIRDRRHAGESLDTILRRELERYRRFDELLRSTPAMTIESRSFQPYVSDRVCGANGLMMGEAASMPDPLTGNGVTSGIRHARHAVDAILGSRSRPAFTASHQRAYTRHVFRLGHAFNAHIERAIYGPTVRHASDCRPPPTSTRRSPSS